MNIPARGAPSDPTPLSRCQVGAGAQNPLVTEWDASQKARLEGLLGVQPVLVRYTGCKLEIVEQCQPSGGYSWTRTTLSTDAVEIRSEDELYAKLPVGAAKLSGELSKRGQLSIRTRVAGQLRLTNPVSDLPASAACASATHVVSAVSLGAFQLLDRSSEHLAGSVGTEGAELGASTNESVRVLRSAGDDSACTNATKEAADPNCASPLQLFLTPIEREDPAKQSAGPNAVQITFPARDDEPWVLQDANNQILCTTPCTRWVPPDSGYVLRNGSSSVKLPASLAFPKGEPALASYSPRRGSPTASAWLFWGAGAWLPFPGVTMTVLGIDAATADPADCDPNEDPFCENEGDNATFFLVSGGVFMALFGASLYFYVISEDESFGLQPNALGTARTAPNRLALQLGPGVVRGTF